MDDMAIHQELPPVEHRQHRHIRLRTRHHHDRDGMAFTAFWIDLPTRID